jgi:hypothetical protein
MKCGQALAGALALELFMSASAATAPQTTPNVGCLGESYSVTIERHVHAKTNVRQTGGYQRTGFAMSTDLDFQIHGVYVSEIRDGKLRWVSRSIDWKGQYLQSMPQCNAYSSDAAGQLELGPSDGGPYAMTDAQRSQFQWTHKKGDTFGNCFRVQAAPAAPLPFPGIFEMDHDKLRGGCCYNNVLKDGTRESEKVDQRGNENLTIRADRTEIVPNRSCTDKSCKNLDPDEATSALTVRATCSGLPLPDREIGLRIDVMPRSGRHNHLGTKNQPRPRGKLARFIDGSPDIDCGADRGLPAGVDDKACITVKTDSNGVAKATFKSPLTGSIDAAKYGSYISGIAGNYQITAKDARITEVRANTTVLAAVENLQAATFDGNLVQGRGDTSFSAGHPEGSYGTTKTVQNFKALAEDFVLHQKMHNTQLANCKDGPKPRWSIVQLQANDIALPMGGVFDWNLAGASPTPWRPSHQTHNKGEGGDFNRLGAGADNSGLRFNDVGTECGGRTVVKQFWQAHLLLNLGTKYGHWDCTDLQGKPASNDPGAIAWNPYLAINGALSKSAPATFKSGCEQGEFSDPSYFPPRLHLHVED